VPFNWESFPDYLNALAKRRADVDFAAQLPHSPLRVYVMGERAGATEAPTEADLAEMRRLVSEAVRAGALGVSTSRVNAHRFRDGTLAPSVGASEEELKALASGLRDADAGVFQVAPDVFDETKREFALLRRIAETAGRPLSFTITAGVREDWADSLDCLTDANREGVEMRGQIIPRPFGFLFGLNLSYHPFSLNPSYRAIADFPLAEKVSRMRDPAFRAQLLSEEADDRNPYVLWLVTQSHLLFPLGESLNYTPRIKDSLAARAAATGVDERELIYDELLKDDGRAVLLSPKGNLVDGDMAAGRRVLKHDNVIIGLADGGAHYGVICDASLPTWFLIDCVRDASPDDRFTLPEAIRILTRDTAVAVGLEDRGLLRVGYKADLNIIDFERLSMAAPQMNADLPAGGRRLRQGSTGYVATIVSGVVTYRKGQATGALPGRLVRGAQQPDTIGAWRLYAAQEGEAE
jgi:N-acyl-D-aspartate/D-glutamate deacylase